jgi:alpha-methylacyl-CoA racemase
MLNRNGPLKGVRVVEFAGLGPAPFACMMLADMGAEVVRIARPGQKPLFGIDQRYNLYDRSRPSITLDLRDTDDHAQALSLCDRADIVIEGYRPGVMERLGFAPATLLARNPRLVFGRMTGWGQEGPLKDRAGHDINYMAISGALWAIGPADAPPPPPQNIVADLAGGGMMLVTGVLAALTHARAHGEGQVVDTCMSDGAALMMVMQYGLKAAGIGHAGARGSDILNGGSAWYQCYETKDGGYIAIGAIEPQFFAALTSAVGRADDPIFARQYDPDAQAAMQEALRALFLEKTRDEWAGILDDIDACAAPVLSLDEAPAHPHNAARGTFVTTGDIVQPGPCPRFSATPSDPPTDGDAGQITVEKVLAAWD